MSGKFIGERKPKRKAKGVDVIVEEPVLNESTFFGSRVANDMRQLKEEASLLLPTDKRMT